MFHPSSHKHLVLISFFIFTCWLQVVILLFLSLPFPPFPWHYSGHRPNLRTINFVIGLSSLVFRINVNRKEVHLTWELPQWSHLILCIDWIEEKGRSTWDSLESTHSFPLKTWYSSYTNITFEWMPQFGPFAIPSSSPLIWVIVYWLGENVRTMRQDPSVSSWICLWEQRSNEGHTQQPEISYS